MTSDVAPAVLIQTPTEIEDEGVLAFPGKPLPTLPVVDSLQTTAPGIIQAASEGFPFPIPTEDSTEIVKSTDSSAPILALVENPDVDSVPASLPASQIVNISAPDTVYPASIFDQATKSKKENVPPVVTMATAVTATSGGPGTQGENTGRWTAEEHRLFLQGLEQHGKGWKKIASLIKSRTVVQIRTHAQKYFQKLAKARQNGEEGEISMEGRGGPTSVTSGGLPGIGFPSSKRRRQTTGTKRKAIASVVISATREGKSIAAAQAAAGVSCPAPPLPAVAPALAPFVVPHPQPAANVSSPPGPSISTSHGSISGSALEDSL